MKKFSLLFFLITNLCSVIKPVSRSKRLKKIIQGNIKYSIKNRFSIEYNLFSNKNLFKNKKNEIQKIKFISAKTINSIEEEIIN